MGQIGVLRCEVQFEPLVRLDRQPARLTPQPAQAPTAEAVVSPAPEPAAVRVPA